MVTEATSLATLIQEPVDPRPVLIDRDVYDSITAYLSAVDNLPQLPDTVPGNVATPEKQNADNAQACQDHPLETVLPNGIIIYGTPEIVAAFREICEQYDIWSNPGVVDIPQDEWMKLPTIPGSKPQRSQVYRQAKDSQQVIDEAFDALHAQGKMSFAKHQAQGVNPVFVVWKWVTRTDEKGNAKLQRVGRAVVDNRPTNKNLVPDLYPSPGQDEIIALAKGKRLITIVDAAKFFYQWRIYPDYYGHQAVMSHRGQEVLHVVAMGNSNSIAYVQRQMDKILRAFRKWCRTYRGQRYRRRPRCQAPLAICKAARIQHHVRPKESTHRFSKFNAPRQGHRFGRYVYNRREGQSHYLTCFPAHMQAT